MKKVIKFSKFFIPAVVLSAVVIVCGIVCAATRGINFGLDFKPGMIEEVRIAPTVLKVSYNGTASISLDMNEVGMDVVISGIGEENRTETILYVDNPTTLDVAKKLNAISGINVTAVVNQPISEDGLFLNSAVSAKLNAAGLNVYAADAEKIVNADELREALKGFEGVDVKTLGKGASTSYQIRLGLDKDATGKSIQEETIVALKKTFGEDNVAIVKSDFIGSQFSKNLVRDSILLVLATLVLIWIYSTIRFYWDFALAAVLAVIHDSLVMVAFIAFTQIEFSTTTIAAILTIVGYSINATVVILDRVRSDMKKLKTDNFKDILNSALSATLSRSIITTVTTLFAVVALFVFTTGTIHDFAHVLIIGLISGAYSSIFIAGALISTTRRNFKNEGAISVKENVVEFQPEE